MFDTPRLAAKPDISTELALRWNRQQIRDITRIYSVRAGNILSTRLTRKSRIRKKGGIESDSESMLRAREIVITYTEIKKKISTPTYPLGAIPGK